MEEAGEVRLLLGIAFVFFLITLRIFTAISLESARKICIFTEKKTGRPAVFVCVFFAPAILANKYLHSPQYLT